MKKLSENFVAPIVIILAIGILPMPYGYYTILRIIATLAFGVLAFITFNSDKKLLSIVSGLFAILFNPIIPVYLSKGIWIVLDVIAALSLVLINHFANKK